MRRYDGTSIQLLSSGTQSSHLTVWYFHVKVGSGFDFVTLQITVDSSPSLAGILSRSLSIAGGAEMKKR